MLLKWIETWMWTESEGLFPLKNLQVKYFRKKKFSHFKNTIELYVVKAIMKIRKNNSVGRLLCTGFVLKDIHEAIKN